MRPINLGEIESIVATLRPLAGARLQRVYCGDQDLVMELYGPGGEFWLWWDLSPRCPMVVVLNQKPRFLPKKQKPLGLFLRSHGVNRHLVKIERPEGMGRVLRLRFGSLDDNDDANCIVEARLFPHGQNLGVQEGGKEIWWKKPQELAASQDESQGSTEDRSVEELAKQWLATRFAKVGSKERGQASEAGDKELKRELGRKQRAIEKIESDLKKNRDLVWRRVADWLNQNQTLQVPDEWADFVDQGQSFSWNLERCYQKAKDFLAKKEGTRQRLESLRQEVESLRAGETSSSPQQKKAGKPSRGPGTGGSVKARKLEMGDRFVAYVGKSAKDNLQLLRQARAWDLWLHLRDYPGSHCIIHRNKGEQVPDQVLQEAAQWVAKATFGRKAEQKSGEKLTVLFAECRHVRPIKGDKMGRVTFRNETTLTIEFTP